MVKRRPSRKAREAAKRARAAARAATPQRALALRRTFALEQKAAARRNVIEWTPAGAGRCRGCSDFAARLVSGRAPIALADLFEGEPIAGICVSCAAVAEEAARDAIKEPGRT